MTTDMGRDMTGDMGSVLGSPSFGGLVVPPTHLCSLSFLVFSLFGLARDDLAQVGLIQNKQDCLRAGAGIVAPTNGLSDIYGLTTCSG